MIKSNGEIVPPLKCATCPINVGCAWACLRGDDLAEIYVLSAALRQIVDAPVPYPNQGLQLIARKALEA